MDWANTLECPYPRRGQFYWWCLLKSLGDCTNANKYQLVSEASTEGDTLYQAGDYSASRYVIGFYNLSKRRTAMKVLA